MEEIKLTQNYSNPLEDALSAILGHAGITRDLSKVLAFAVERDTVSYQEIKKVIKDGPEEVLLLAFEWRLLLPISTTKSSSWEDRLLLLEDGEKFEVPNIISYLVQEGLYTGKWQPEKIIIKFFKELGDMDYKMIPGLVRGISQEAVNHKISADKIKMICNKFGMGNRVDSLIAELKAANIISPRLRSIPEVNREGSPIYELNPSVMLVRKRRTSINK